MTPNLDAESWPEFLVYSQFDVDLWARVESPRLTHLFNYTQKGMACGPVSHTVLFGACLSQKINQPQSNL